MHSHDQLDRDLIALLRRDGRAPIAKLAEVLGVSRGAVQKRIDRLQTSGALLGFTIRVREDIEEGAVRAVGADRGGGAFDQPDHPQTARHSRACRLAHDQWRLGSGRAA